MKLKWMEMKYYPEGWSYQVLVNGEIAWKDTDKVGAKDFLDGYPNAIEIDPYLAEFLLKWRSYIPEEEQASFVGDVEGLWEQGIAFAQENVGEM